MIAFGLGIDWISYLKNKVGDVLDLYVNTLNVNGTTPLTVFNVAYYPELHIAITFC